MDYLHIYMWIDIHVWEDSWEARLVQYDYLGVTQGPQI